MVKAYGNTLEVKVRKGSLYMMPDGSVVKAILLNAKDNRLDIKYYNREDSVDTIELDTAIFYVKPLFTIQEVAKMFNKATDTLRKYERLGILPRCPQYKLGGRTARLYSIDDIMEVAEVLAQRRPVGRPPARKIDISKVNQKDLMDGLLKRYRRK